jgi:hypothetical protein
MPSRTPSARPTSTRPLTVARTAVGTFSAYRVQRWAPIRWAPMAPVWPCRAMAILVEEEQAEEGEADVDQAVQGAAADPLEHLAGRLHAAHRAVLQQVRQAVRLAQRGLPPVVDGVAGHRDPVQPFGRRQAFGVGAGDQLGQRRRLVRGLGHAQHQRRHEDQRRHDGHQGRGQDLAAPQHAQRAPVQRPGGDAQDRRPQQRQHEALGHEQGEQDDRQRKAGAQDAALVSVMEASAW